MIRIDVEDGVSLLFWVGRWGLSKNKTMLNSVEVGVEVEVEHSKTLWSCRRRKVRTECCQVALCDI